MIQDMITKQTADILLAVGSLIGLSVKYYALQDNNTVWSRKSSGLNIITYPITGLLPFYALGLWFTFTITLFNWLIWIGIYLFRHPKSEEYLPGDKLKQLLLNIRDDIRQL